ncbi:MAG: hypothetical protein DDT19_02616 [Syntrophomonadaceae bacterium]|nr:hypothetical protein [Bacillota bacterium]
MVGCGGIITLDNGYREKGGLTPLKSAAVGRSGFLWSVPRRLLAMGLDMLFAQGQLTAP